MVARPARREADAAIAHDRGGDAVLRRRRDVLAPGHLAVIMGVDIDKAGRHQFALGVDLVGALAQDLADFADAAIGDRDVGFEKLAARSVGDVAAANHEVWVGHGISPRLTGWRIMGCPPDLSTGGGGVQECIRPVTGASERACALRSVTIASSTVRTCLL